MANRIKVAIASSIETLRQRGLSFRQTAPTLGIDRATVARHMRRAQQESKLDQGLIAQ